MDMGLGNADVDVVVKSLSSLVLGDSDPIYGAADAPKSYALDSRPPTW